MHHLVLSQYPHLSDRQANKIATAIPYIALHAVAGKTAMEVNTLRNGEF